MCDTVSPIVNMAPTIFCCYLSVGCVSTFFFELAHMDDATGMMGGKMLTFLAL